MLPSDKKWENMLAIVNHNASLVQTKPILSFKKLSISRFFRENILVFLLQYTGLMFGPLSEQMSPIWFASGTACAFIFLRGYSVLPGIWLGSLFGYFFAKNGLFLSLSSATLLATQAGAILWLSHRFITPTLIFYQKKTWLIFLLCSALVSCMTSYCLTRLFHSPDVLRWSLANFNGSLIFGCAIIAWDAYFPEIEKLKQRRKRDLYFSFGLLFIFMTALIFSTQIFTALACVLSLSLLILIISIQYRWRGAIAAIFLLGFILGLSANIGTPIWTTAFSKITLLYLQLFLSLLTAGALTLGITLKR